MALRSEKEIYRAALKGTVIHFVIATATSPDVRSEL